jgi:hypothetical protein
MTRHEPPSTTKPDYLLVALCVAALLYVFFALTPSSYEIVLSQMGTPGNGLWLGEARYLRADEWAIWTPSFQAAVNNDFGRFNETSLYREDLRNFWGLPLMDWSIVFKPYFWPFFVASPAIAFSFYHAFFIVAFVLGYRRLFEELGATRDVAGLVSIALLCSNHVQGFWTTYNTIFAGFPWIILAAVSSMRPWIKCSVTAYLVSSWMLAHLYPTLMIPLAFVGAITVAVLRPRSLSWRGALAVATGLAIGALVVYGYLRDVIAVMANTSYPGQRVSGGGGLPYVLWLSQLLPFFTTDDYETFVGPKDWFYLAVGSYLPLLVLAFVDWGRLFERLRRASDTAGLVRRGCIGFGAGLALTSAWMLFPLPPALGVPLLWHKSLPDRMLFPCGLMLVMLALIVLAAAPLRVGWGRVLGASGIIAGGWLVSRWVVGSLSVGSGWRHLLVPAALGAVALVVPRVPGRERVLLVGWAAAANVVGFGAYNPLQSAVPIFRRPKTELTAALDRWAARHEQGWLVIEGVYGAGLNGWGYAAAKHVLLAPQLDFFRRALPDLPEDELQRVFNRFLHVHVTPLDHPVLFDSQDSAAVPLHAFGSPSVPIDVHPSLEERLPVGGEVGHQAVYQETSGRGLVVTGSVLADLSATDTRLTVVTSLPVSGVAAYPLVAPQLPPPGRPPLSTFVIVLDVDPSWVPAGESVCVVSDDRELGRHLLATRFAHCEHLMHEDGAP